MNKVQKIKISKGEAIINSTKSFIEWYSAGKPGKLEKGALRKMYLIMDELKISEIGELISFWVLKKHNYDPIYSNIHLKASAAFATSVDLIVKTDKKYYFTEVKTPLVPTSKNIKNNLSLALKEIKKRLSDLERQVAFTELDIENTEIVSEKWDGIAAIVSAKGEDTVLKDQKRITFFIEVNEDEEDLHSSILEALKKEDYE